MHVDAFLRSKLWFNGPDFLCTDKSQWTQVTKECLLLDPNGLEVKRVTQANAVTIMESPINKLIEHFSQWKDLKRAVAWLLKLKDVLKTKLKRKDQIVAECHVKTNHLSVEDLARAEQAVVSHVQQQHFKTDIESLQEKGSVKTSSRISNLDPFLDVDGILKVGGRLSRLAMPVTQQQNILSKDSHVAKLHKNTGHCGRNYMVLKLRQLFWVPCANALARKTINNCVFCRRHQGRTGEQKMALLPVERITPDLPPFTYAGIDYFRPIEVKRGRFLVKRYGVIFTCLTSRAIHLEISSSLDTDSCINAIQRFICRRGPVNSIKSDQGTNFISSQRELSESLKSLNYDKIHDMLAMEGVKWEFNPPSTPHYGGVWERLIKSLKKVLQSLFHEQTLDDEGLSTVFCEVEAIMNDRPLTTVSNDLEPLTPNHLESTTCDAAWHF